MARRGFTQATGTGTAIAESGETGGVVAGEGGATILRTGEFIGAGGGGSGRVARQVQEIQRQREAEAQRQAELKRVAEALRQAELKRQAEEIAKAQELATTQRQQQELARIQQINQSQQDNINKQIIQQQPVVTSQQTTIPRQPSIQQEDKPITVFDTIEENRIRNLQRVQDEKIGLTPEHIRKGSSKVAGLFFIPAGFVSKKVESVFPEGRTKDFLFTPTISKEAAKQSLGDTLLLSSFGGLTPTTIEVARQLPQTTGVLFKGLQQTAKDKTIITKIGFKTSTGKVGTATGRTAIAGQVDDVTIAVTKAGGSRTGTTLDLVTGNIKNIVKDRFKGLAISGSKQAGSKQVTGSVGAVSQNIKTIFKVGKTSPTQTGRVSSFVSTSLGQTTDDITKILSGLKSGTNRVFGIGQITKIPSVTKDIVSVGGKGTVSSLKQVGSTALKDVVKAGVQTQSPVVTSVVTPSLVSVVPTAPLVIPKVDTVQVTTMPTQFISTQQRQFTLPKVNLAQAINVKQNTRTKTAVSTRQLTKTKQQTKQQIKQQQNILQTQSTKQLQRTGLKLRQQQRTKQVQRGLAPVIIPIPFIKPTFPKFIIPLPGGRVKTPRRSGRFTVSVRRFGKFKPIGTFGTLGKAFGVGRRRVAGTLAATFRVEGTKLPGTPKGFYKKDTKLGTLFIEKRKFRISKRGEKVEIKKAKRRKKK